MTTIDTAALDAAIHSIRTTDSILSARTAIAILVADEVSLRLAAAPTVDDAIAALERNTFAHGKVPGTPDGLNLAVAREQDRNALHAAITAHVEAEVARRLAVADSVDDAGPDGLAEVEAEQVASIERLRAAIAADRERAVAEATDGAVQGERFAAAICRLVGARETGTGGQTVDACTASLYADAAKRIDRMIARDKARPTPDEARRMINELIGSMAVVGNGLDDSPGAVVAKRIAADARKALLRALGVEA